MAFREHLGSIAGTVAAGSLAGLVATVPMTATMLFVSRFFTRSRQHLREPRHVTNVALYRTGLSQSDAVDDQQGAIQLAAHVAYGAAAGSIYPAVERYIPLPEKYQGAAFGLGVYAASYVGWLPALDVLPPPQRRPAGRTAVLVAAHSVWGASLGAMYRALRSRRRREHQAIRGGERRTNTPELRYEMHQMQRTP
jgi:uncharacterized membrane protein YagU involved in acid resistance